MSNKNTSDGKSKNNLRSTIATGFALGSIAAILSFVYFAIIERPANNSISIEIQAQTIVNSQVSQISLAIDQLDVRLSSIAQSQDLIAALENNNQTLIEQYQRELNRAFPEALSVKLIALGRLGIATLDKERHNLRSNIELDILRSVSNGNEIEPEAYKAGEQWLFSLAKSIKSPEKRFANGAILLTLDGNYLKNILSQLDPNLGRSSFVQHFRNRQNLITSTGADQPSEHTVSAGTSSSLWKIHFTPSTELVNSASLSSNIVWILLAVIIATTAGSAIFTIVKLQQLLRENINKLIKNRSKTSSFTLPGFKKVHDNLAKKSRTETPAGGKTDSTAVATDDKPKSTQTNSASEVAINEIKIDIPETIFRAYDIRGVADSQLSDEIVYAIGLAIGSEALDQGQQNIVVASDGRISSPRIREAMISGLLASGRDVIDIGMQPTPLMYFATHELGTKTGVMITGSHNPTEYNGIKIVIGGRALNGDSIQSLRQRIINRQLHSGSGSRQSQDVEQTYIDYIINDVAIAQPLKVVIDAGNGVTGEIAPKLFEELGCEVVPLFCEIDGSFPNHHPDPSVEANLEALKRAVQEQEADLGIAFDGDGDRLGIVTATGKSVAADRLLMIFAQDVVSRNPGADVIFDVKCTRYLNTLISNYGGRPIMWKTGHSFIKEKMAETGALLGGEFSGHIFFKERWFGFDDGMYAAARLIEILSTTDPDLDVQLEAFPESISTAELRVETSEEKKFTTIDQLIDSNPFEGGKISTLDGLRVEYPDGWGLVRASNTTPMLILRFESDTQEAMTRIQTQFKEQLSSIDDSLQFDF